MTLLRSLSQFQSTTARTNPALLVISPVLSLDPGWLNACTGLLSHAVDPLKLSKCASLRLEGVSTRQRLGN